MMENYTVCPDSNEPVSAVKLPKGQAGPGVEKLWPMEWSS